MLNDEETQQQPRKEGGAVNALLNYPGAKWGMAEEIDKAYFELQEKAFEEYTSQMRIDGI